ALVPHLDRAAMAAFLLADAHPFGVVAIGAEGRTAGGADPFVAALMALLLLLEALLKRFHQLLPAAESLNCGLLLVCEGQLGELAQPLFRNFRGCGIGEKLDAV